jgi:osmotically-inducible protein OsmY
MRQPACNPICCQPIRRTGRAVRRLGVPFAALLLVGSLCSCGRDGAERASSERAIHVDRGPQGTEIEFNPGAARRNVDQAGRDLQRGAREVGQAVGPAARQLGEKLEQGARELQVKAGPAARQAGRQLEKGAKQVGRELGPAARQAGDALARGARQVGDTVGPAVRHAAADASLTAAVKAKLIADPEVKALAIDVSTTDGVVTLSGRVATAGERATAGRVAAGTDGVQRVVNALQVGPG